MLGGSAVLALGLGGGVFYKRQDKLPTPSPLLRALVDTIVPRDAHAGGLDIALDNQLFAQAHTIPERKERVARLLNSISNLSLKQFKMAFHLATIDQREQLLNDLLANKQNAIARRDLMRIRNTLLGMYYASVEGASSIGYLLPARYSAYRK